MLYCRSKFDVDVQKPLIFEGSLRKNAVLSLKFCYFINFELKTLENQGHPGPMHTWSPAWKKLRRTPIFASAKLRRKFQIWFGGQAGIVKNNKNNPSGWTSLLRLNRIWIVSNTSFSLAFMLIWMSLPRLDVIKIVKTALLLEVIKMIVRSFLKLKIIKNC